MIRRVGLRMPAFSRGLVLRAGGLRSLHHRRGRGRGLVARYPARAGAPALRVGILTAEVGEGHLAAARVLAAELVCERADVEVLVCDALVGLGRFLRYVLLDAYRGQLRFAPWIFGLLYGLFARFRALRGLGRAGLAFFGARSLLRFVDGWRPDIVVSTYPAATSVLGSLRRRGRLTVPTCATATDLAGLEFWAHPGIDLHLVMHESCLAPVERLAGPGRARQVRPLVAPAFFDACSAGRARRRLGLPLDRPVVVVSGGGWGVGDLKGAVKACLQLPAVTVVCLTARNEPLRKRLSSVFADEARVRVLGFTAEMSELLAAADAIVHSTGGVTCLEALVRGCPIVAYGAPPGHAPRTARAMAELGLLETASSPTQLAAALRRALALPAGERPRLAPAPGAAALVLAAEPRPSAAPPWRPRLARSAAAAAATLLGGWAFLSDDAYPLVARTLALKPIAHIPTDRPQVGLVLRVPAAYAPTLAVSLRQRHAHASFAFTAAPDRQTLQTITVAGDEPLPELGPGALTNWLDTKDELKRSAHALDLATPRFYLAPATGFTASQYLLGRDIGATPIVGSARIGRRSRHAASSFRRGEIIVLTLGSTPQSDAKALEQLLARLARQRLAPVSFSQLYASRQ